MLHVTIGPNICIILCLQNVLLGFFIYNLKIKFIREGQKAERGFLISPLQVKPITVKNKLAFAQSPTSVVLTDRKRTAQILRAKTLRVLRQR